VCQWIKGFTISNIAGQGSTIALSRFEYYEVTPTM
jgi:hypothetical protein